MEVLFYTYEKLLFYGLFLALNDQLANKEFANARSLVNVRRFLLHHYDLFCQISTQKYYRRGPKCFGLGQKILDIGQYAKLIRGRSQTTFTKGGG